MRAVARLPLPALLARALGDLTAAFVRAGAGADGVPSVPMWFGMLRVVDQAGVLTRDVPARARLSSRVVRQGLQAARRSGWVVVERNRGQPPRVALTAAGRRARRAWESMVPDVESEWSARIGRPEVEELRRRLAAVVRQLDLELPHYPISYGTADRSVTGGWSHVGQDGPPRIPPHGDDWRPVVRGRDDTVSALSLTALLSQALVAFTIDCESAGPGSLALADGLAAAFGKRDAVPLDELPPALGVTGSGRSGPERHGFLVVAADPQHPPRRVATLTARGLRARDAHGPRLRSVEAMWHTRYGRDAVAGLRDALQEVDAELDPSLPTHLIVSGIR